MKSKRSGMILVSLLLLSVNVFSAQTEIIMAEPVQQEMNQETFVANNIMVGKVFDAIAERLNKPIILSKLAAQKRITGNFNLAHADEMFKALTRRIALVWYDDGAAIYVYDNSEMRSAIIPMNNASSHQVLNYIKKNGIYDQRFPVRTQGGNSLLFVSGPPLYVELIQAATAYLDEQVKQEALSGGELAVIAVKYASVTDRTYSLRGNNITVPGMLSVISELFKNTPVGTVPTQKIASAPKDNIGDDIDALMDAPIGEAVEPMPAFNGTRNPSNVPFSLVAHPDSNSLIVKGSPEQIRYVRQLVGTLDTRRRQVELSLWIIDITRSELDNLGVNWEVGTINTGNSSFSFNRSTLSDSTDFLLRIDALSKSGNGHIVSRPVLLTQENIPALFDNNTSFYAKLQGERIATLEQVTYGTMVSVMPRISAGNHVEMEVNIEDGAEKQSKNGETSNVEGLPSVNRTTINTVARIAQNSSLLIGGYTREQIVENESHIPLLGDIPLVGRLFSHSSMNKQKMVRLFLIQPRLLDENEVWDGRQFSENLRIKQHDKQLHSTIQFLKTYMGGIMAIAPLGGGARMLGGAQEKSRSSKTGDDSDEVLRGQGVIDSSGEYASMSMLAASHVKRSSGKQDDTEDWMQFAERILDENADETILNVEGILNRQFMTPKELKAFLLRFFSDPSDLLMALAALINRGKLKQEQLEQLKKLEEQLHQEDFDRSTQAGVNIALIAKAFAQKNKTVGGNLRMLYREFLAYEGPVVYLYEQWVEEMESQERENIMRYLSRALACDLQALPLGDINMGEFGNYFMRVGRLRELQSLDHVFIQQFFQSNLFKHHRQFINEKFEKELSKLFTAGIRNQTNFNEGLLLFISSQLSMMSTDLRARFLQLLILAFATIPVSVFQSLEARDELINQLKDCMHYVMAQEELMMRNYFQREDF